MTFHQELQSWRWGSLKGDPAPVPECGSKAPTSPKLPLPDPNGKPIIIAFLRHCGCPCKHSSESAMPVANMPPVAEKTFQQLRNVANKHKDVNFIAISHSDEPSTEKWVISVGGEWNVKVIVDAKRELYLAWGLGVSSAWHVLSPWSMMSVYKLATAKGPEKIVNRPTESGTRWQTSGSFAVGKDGIVTWVSVAKAADFIPDFAEALRSLGLDA